MSNMHMHNQANHAMMNGKANQNPLQMNNMGPMNGMNGMNGMNYNSNRQYHHNNNHPQVCYYYFHFGFSERKSNNIQ